MALRGVNPLHVFLIGLAILVAIRLLLLGD